MNDRYGDLLVNGLPAREVLSRAERSRLLALKWEMQHHSYAEGDVDDESIWRGPIPMKDDDGEA